MGRELRCGEWGKKKGTYPDFSENRGEWGNKKATASEVACRGYNLFKSYSIFLLGWYYFPVAAVTATNIMNSI